MSYERIDRSNLIGMGVLPLQFADGQDADALGLDGSEAFDIGTPSPDHDAVSVTATDSSGKKQRLHAYVRIDTPKE